ncbi:MAG: hypothetical protein IPH12_00795 [Saprospirales bacterium]|nr:hypothetical protein [Saprospirales bacterium]
MKSIKWKWVAKAVFFGALAIAVFTGATMLLWNTLATALFGLPAINFFQTIGLMFLGRLLTGGFARGGWGGDGFGRRHPMRERWQSMSEDERRQYMQHWGRGRCGPARQDTPHTGPDDRETTA